MTPEQRSLKCPGGGLRAPRSGRHLDQGRDVGLLGEVLILDYFASRRCSVVIGDLTAKFRPQPPGERYVELASIDGVRVFAAERLMPLLAAAGPTLRLAGPRFAQHLALWLDQPERWIEFLEQPGVVAGKRPWRRRS